MNNFLKWVNLFSFLAMIVVNALANFIPLGGNTTGKVSSYYPTLFTPAPYTFSIWGVIYILMGIFAIFQLGFSKNTMVTTKIVSNIGIWFFISCIMNIAWIFCWHYQRIGLSLIAIIGLLFSLIQINIHLTTRYDSTFWEHMIVSSFNLYLGWICAATIVNIGVLLVKNQWQRFGLSEQFWTILVLIIGTIIGFSLVLTGHRYFATVAIIWAYIGIFIKHISSSGYRKTFPTIITTLLIMITIMLCSILLSIPSQFEDTNRIERKI